MGAIKTQLHPTCQLCGGPHLYDMSIPQNDWNDVVRKNKRPEMLCASCIIAVFAKERRNFTATLWNHELNGVRISCKFIEERP